MRFKRSSTRTACRRRAAHWSSVATHDGDDSDDGVGSGARATPAFAVSAGYRRYVLVLLLLVYIFNFVDRQILSVLLQSIKQEFSFSDTQLGLLGGIAFALFYSIVGFPMAWMADRFNRRNIMAISLGLWSLMTATCGLATGFVSLFLTRVGVGVGEAGGMPPSYSMIADYFPPERRATAMAVFGMGIPFGVLTGFLLGGWVNEFFGWRSAFMVVGIPGVLLALLVGITLREPPRGVFDKQQGPDAPPSILATVRHLWVLPACRHLCLAASLYGLAAWGAGVWQPSFFMRIHHMSSGQAGTWLALVFGLSGATGAFLGGAVGDRLYQATQDVRWYAWISAGGVLVSIPFVFLVYLWPTPIPALLFLIIPTIFGHMYLGPVMALLLGIAGAQRRAVASAVYAFVLNLFSMGVGPLLVGLSSDHLQPRYGNAGLRYSILTLVVVATSWAAVHFLLAARTIRADLAAAEAGR
jgi:predicted MFS family arabinose efflux permease